MSVDCLTPQAWTGHSVPGLQLDGDRHACGLRDAAREVGSTDLWWRFGFELGANRVELGVKLLELMDPLGDLCLLLLD